MTSPKAASSSTIIAPYRDNSGQIVGRTAYLQPAHVMAPEAIIGRILPTKIESLERYSLLGELATAQAQPASTPMPNASEIRMGA